MKCLPVSDHCNGQHYFNPGNVRKKGLWDVLKWRLNAKPKPWPLALPPLLTIPQAQVYGDEIILTFIGHATVLIQTGGYNILTDPIWSTRAGPFNWIGPKRVVEPAVLFENLPKIDLVVISHNHYDHLDLNTLKQLWQRDQPQIVAPLGHEKLLAKMGVKVLDWYESSDIAPHLRVSLAQAQHWSGRGLLDRDRALWGSFILTVGANKIYFAGDSGWGNGSHFSEAKRRFGPFQVALLPIGAYEPRWFMRYGHMNPEEAVQAHLALEAPVSMAIHFGTFHLADEGYFDPVQALEAAKEKYAIPKEHFRALRHGETWVL